MAETTKRKDAGIKRVQGDLKTYTFSLNTVKDVDVIEAIEGGVDSRSSMIRKLLHMGVKVFNKGKKQNGSI